MLEIRFAALARVGWHARRKRWLRPVVIAFTGAVIATPALAQKQVGRTLAPFLIWRTTTLGSYKGVDGYREALDAAKIKIGDAADEILGRPAFAYVKGEINVELTLVSAAELGVEKETTLADFYRRGRQLGLELCHPEVGPQLRLEYRDQPVGEIAPYHDGADQDLRRRADYPVADQLWDRPCTRGQQRRIRVRGGTVSAVYLCSSRAHRTNAERASDRVELSAEMSALPEVRRTLHISHRACAKTAL
jgi:hypothetical protein